MNISIFDVTGPVMIGPSSSHTAGAARLARIAAKIAGDEISHVSFGLHGSFAKTYRGHGTDRALIAGVLGLKADDERLRNSFALAQQQNLTYDFYELHLDGVHDNSVVMTFTLADGKIRRILGSSVGGGQIVIRKIDELEVELTAQSPTLIISQLDKKGVVSAVTGLLAARDINIGVMKVSRVSKGQVAICVIETDSELSAALVEQVANLNYVLSAQALHPDA